jgi:DNA-binding FadR family transcriptional regulator
LATQLSVSRPSVREALIAMEVEGVIEVRTGSGIYVKSLGKKGHAKPSPHNTQLEWGPLEVMRARFLIEAEMAALAAENASAQDIKAMKLALKGMQKDAQAGQIPRDSDIAFHMAIAKACANSVMIDTLDQYLQARTGSLFERLGDYFESPAAWAAAILEHQAVIQAIEAGEAHPPVLSFFASNSNFHLTQRRHHDHQTKCIEIARDCQRHCPGPFRRHGQRRRASANQIEMGARL